MKKANLIFVIAIMLFLTANGIVSAQSKSTMKRISTDGSRPLFHIDFKGGTIDEYVKLLREFPNSAGESGTKFLNLIVSLEAKDFQLPSIEIQGDMRKAIQFLPRLHSRRNSILVEKGGDGIYVISLEGEEIEVSVVSVLRLLNSEGIDKDTLLAAIEIGLEMRDAGKSVSLKLHNETGLLFIKGPGSCIELVLNIINQLEKTRGQHLLK